MNYRIGALLALVMLSARAVHAAEGTACDSKLIGQFEEVERFVGSLRPDKAGQMRVFASNGDEFTAGQAQWMKEQLQLVGRYCSDGDPQQASLHLAQVQQLIKDHHGTD